MKSVNIYSATTNSIEVTVEPIFLPDQSITQSNFYVWAYNVQITNNSKNTVQLKNRYWRIIDEHGAVNEVSGPGVIGEQPTLKQSENFQYSSGTYLMSPSGIMEGTYEMEILSNGKRFEVKIPAFSLDSPFVNHTPS